ncbi:MAG: hypothetical protein ACRYGK_18420, partial [Janthinobacterium lividum]
MAQYGSAPQPAHDSPCTGDSARIACLPDLCVSLQRGFCRPWPTLLTNELTVLPMLTVYLFSQRLPRFFHLTLALVLYL